LILVILLGLLIPFPLLLHCLFLTTLNRRPHPVLVWGLWDFAEVLFAASGFLLFGGPCILAGFNQNYRDYLLLGPLRPAPKLTAAGGYLWLALWVGYFALVVAGAGFMLCRRRLATSIYNVEPEAFQESLAAVLDRLKLDWVRGPDGVCLGARNSLGEPAAEEVAEAGYRTAQALELEELHGTRGPERLAVKVDVFPAMRHVALYWPAGADLLRHEVEAGLAKELAGVRTRHNPVGPWLLSVAAALAVVMAFALLFLAFVAYYTMKQPY
jgi:hypothetical protein